MTSLEALLSFVIVAAGLFGALFFVLGVPEHETQVEKTDPTKMLPVPRPRIHSVRERKLHPGIENVANTTRRMGKSS